MTCSDACLVPFERYWHVRRKCVLRTMRDLSSILIKEAASTVHLFRKSFIMIGSPLYNFCKTEVESSFASEQKTFDDLLYFR